MARPDGTVRRSRCCTTSSFDVGAGADGGAGRALRRRQDDASPTWSRGSTTSPAARSGSAATTSATSRQASLHDLVGYVTQDAHMFHDTIRANLRLRAAGRHRRRARAGAARRRRSGDLVGVAARRARHGRRRPRLPAQRRRAAATGDRPVAAQGAAHHRARRGDRAPRQRVRGRRAAGARHRARGPHLAGDRPPAVDRAQRRPDPRRRRRPHRRARHPRRAARRRRPLPRPVPHPVRRAADRRPRSRACRPDAAGWAQWRAWISDSQDVSIIVTGASPRAAAGPPLRSLVDEGAKVVVSSRSARQRSTRPPRRARRRACRSRCRGRQRRPGDARAAGGGRA